MLLPPTGSADAPTCPAGASAAEMTTWCEEHGYGRLLLVGKPLYVDDLLRTDPAASRVFETIAWLLEFHHPQGKDGLGTREIERYAGISRNRVTAIVERLERHHVLTIVGYEELPGAAHPRPRYTINWAALHQLSGRTLLNRFQRGRTPRSFPPQLLHASDAAILEWLEAHNHTHLLFVGKPLLVDDLLRTDPAASRVFETIAWLLAFHQPQGKDGLGTREIAFHAGISRNRVTTIVERLERQHILEIVGSEHIPGMRHARPRYAINWRSLYQRSGPHLLNRYREVHKPLRRQSPVPAGQMPLPGLAGEPAGAGGEAGQVWPPFGPGGSEPHQDWHSSGPGSPAPHDGHTTTSGSEGGQGRPASKPEGTTAGQDWRQSVPAGVSHRAAADNAAGPESVQDRLQSVPGPAAIGASSAPAAAKGASRATTAAPCAEAPAPGPQVGGAWPESEPGPARFGTMGWEDGWMDEMGGGPGEAPPPSPPPGDTFERVMLSQAELAALLHTLVQETLQHLAPPPGSFAVDSLLHTPVAVPPGEYALPCSVADLWAADRAQIFRRDVQQLERLAHRCDLSTEGYGLYWVGRAILDAELAMAEAERPTPQYISGIVRRWERSGDWGSVHPVLQRVEEQIAADLQRRDERLVAGDPAGDRGAGFQDRDAPPLQTDPPPQTDPQPPVPAPQEAPPTPAARAILQVEAARTGRLSRRSRAAMAETVTDAVRWDVVWAYWQEHGYRFHTDQDIRNLLDRYRKEATLDRPHGRASRRDPYAKRAGSPGPPGVGHGESAAHAAGAADDDLPAWVHELYEQGL